MKNTVTLIHKFVKIIPKELEERTLYVSMEYATSIHKCCCGCGREVVTPLSPTDWKLIFNGVSISLLPSIGNWGFDCKSHYWISESKAKWAKRWSNEEIEEGRARDRTLKMIYYAGANTEMKGDRSLPNDKSDKSFWSRLFKLWPTS